MAELTKKQQYWKHHLDALESYEGNTADYAREHDLNPKKLYVARSALAKKQQAAAGAAFTQVNVAATTRQTKAGEITITLPNKVTLTVAPQDAPNLLGHLARL